MASSKKRILIVEDEIIVAKSLQCFLEAQGYQVPEPASSGEEALKAVQSARPDLILMDVRLKGAIDGIAAARSINRFCDSPIICLTAFADERTVARIKQVKCCGYLCKPINDAELKSLIARVLNK
ncbi:MAG: response regulator [Candidatus Omnitrophota bacterium]